MEQFRKYLAFRSPTLLGGADTKELASDLAREWGGVVYVRHDLQIPSPVAATVDAETLVRQWVSTLQDESRVTDEDAEDLTLRIIAYANRGSAAVGEQTESVRYKDRQARYAEVGAANSGGEQVRAEQTKAAGECANCGAPIVEAFATGIGVYWYHVRGLAYCDTDNPSFDRTATPTSTGDKQT